jgi:predicted nucleic acid-binding protein
LICADTAFIIDYLRENPEAGKKMEDIEENQLAITVITSFELYFGIFKGKNIKREQRLKDIEKILSRLVIFPMTHESAINAAKILGRLYRIGKPVNTLDCFIGAISLIHGCSKILTRNKRHYENIEGLTIIEY